ncbi:MAG: GNAT family N-acetyltransferase [Gemmatimonas sp.]|nr:GNAT family N-acetyltransferase [Gemmatimonas sp.]
MRAAGVQDLDTVLTLYRDLNPSDLPAPEERIRAAWTDMLSAPGVSIFIASSRGRAVASCTLAVIPNLTRGARPYAIIENVVTDREVRSQGFGTAILRFTVRKAWEVDCYKVMLLTGSARKATLRFYENAGFRRGIKTGFVAYPPSA